MSNVRFTPGDGATASSLVAVDSTGNQITYRTPASILALALPAVIPGWDPSCTTTGGNFVLVSDTVYAAAVPIRAFDVPITRVLFGVGAVGTGTITGEVAIGTSPASAYSDRANSVVITAQAVTSLNSVNFTSGTTDRDVPLAYTIPAGTQAWVMFHLVSTGSMPSTANNLVIGNSLGAQLTRRLTTGGTISVSGTKTFTVASGSAPGLLLGTV